MTISDIEFEQRLDDFKQEGWSIDKREGDRVTLVKHNHGRALWHAIFFILDIISLGFWLILHILYWANSYFRNSQKKVVRKQDFE